MKVTKIVVTPVHSASRVKATATILFDDVFKVRGIKIMPRTKGKGLFVAFPETRNNRGDYFALAFPVTKELRQELEDQILYECDQTLEREKREKASEADNIEQPLEDPDEE